MNFEANARCMTPGDEQVTALQARRGSVESDLQSTQGIAQKAAHELEAARLQVRKASMRLEEFQKAQKNLRGRAEIVSLREYQTIFEAIGSNEAIIAQYEGLALAAKTKGLAAATRARQLTAELDAINLKLSTYGKVLTFPYIYKSPLDVDGLLIGNDEDDDEEGPDDHP